MLRRDGDKEMWEVEALSLLILELNFTDSRTESVQVEGNYKKLFKRYFVDFFLLNDFRRKGNGSRVFIRCIVYNKL